MRNHLAEEGLNKDILQLFFEYKSYRGQKSKKVQGVTEFFQQTRKIIETITDTRPISYIGDSTLITKTEKHCVGFSRGIQKLKVISL